MRRRAIGTGAVALALALGAVLSPAWAQQPSREERRASPKATQQPKDQSHGKWILQWDHLDDSNDRTFEDFWGFVSYKQAHFQVWSGEFTDGAEIGGYVRDHRRSTYAGLYRFRDDFDHVVQFDTEQILKKGLVWAAMVRGIHVIPDDPVGGKNQVQFGTGVDYYYGEHNFFSTRAISDPREGGRWSFIASNRFHHGESIYVQPAIILHTDSSKGWFLQGKIHWFRWSVGKYDRFDFTEVDRTIYSAGVEFNY